MKRNEPTIFFWNFIGLAIAFCAFGVMWSLIVSSSYKVQWADRKLEVNSTTNKLREVSDNLGERVRTLPIDEAAKQQIQQDLQEADYQLNEIDRELLSEGDRDRLIETD